jgi:PAS domain S-box-containing protein
MSHDRRHAQPPLDPGSPLVGGAWFVRLFLFIAVSGICLTPLSIIMPSMDGPGGALTTGLTSGVGFLFAAALAHRDHRRAALVVAAATLLGVALDGAFMLNDWDPAALGISVVAAVLVLPATPRRATIPTVLVVGAIGAIALVISRVSEASRLGDVPVEVGSVVSAICVLATTLALVAWTHVRLVGALERARRARADLDASESRYRNLIETAPDGILIVDPVSLQALAANRRAAEIFGFETSEAFLAAGPGPAFPDHQPDGRSTLEVAHALVDATLAGERVVQEMVYRRRDGSQFTAEVRSTLAGADGEGHVRLSLTDVSDRVAALRARDLTEARFRSLFASSPNAVLVVDSAGLIVDASDRAVDIFGYPTSALRALAIEDLVPPAHRDSHVRLRAELGRNGSDHGSIRAREVMAVRADGSLIPVEVGLSWFETAEGLFATAIVVDVTARRAAEQAVRDAT